MELLLMILGFVLYILTGMIKTKAKHKDKAFSIVQYLKDDILIITAALIGAFVLFIIMPEISGIFMPKYAGLSKTLAVVVGFTNYHLFKIFIDSVLPKKFIEK